MCHQTLTTEEINDLATATLSSWWHHNHDVINVTNFEHQNQTRHNTGSRQYHTKVLLVGIDAFVASCSTSHTISNYCRSSCAYNVYSWCAATHKLVLFGNVTMGKKDILGGVFVLEISTSSSACLFVYVQKVDLNKCMFVTYHAQILKIQEKK